MTEIRYVEGLYELWDELRARHPGLVLDDCASGGRRIDLETCRRALVQTRSDTACAPGREEAAFERLKKFISASAPEFQLVPRPVAQTRAAGS